MKTLSTVNMENIRGGAFNWKEFGRGFCEGVSFGAAFLLNAPLTISKVSIGVGIGCVFI
jgi:hypothetical protein